MHKKYLAFSAMLLALISAPTVAEELAIKPVGIFAERLENTARISGNIVSSFTANGKLVAEKPFLEIFIPAKWAGQYFCMSLVSNDGLYEGQRNFLIEDSWKGGNFIIRLDTKYEDYLANTNSDSFGSLVSKGKCGTNSQEITLAGWNKSITAKKLDYQILINSYRADEVYLILDKQDEVECSETKNTKKIAFDFVCRIPNKLMTNQNITKVEINRIRRGIFDEPLFISISTN